MNRNLICWVHDQETIVNCFMDVFMNFKTQEMKTFVVHFLRNDWVEYLDFLEESQKAGDWHFAFNGLSFDAQIVEYILKNMKRMRKLTNPDQISGELAAYAAQVIHKKNNGQFLDFPEFRMTIKNHDVFRQSHWNNKAKATSLKWAQYGMDWPNVEEMPHHHTKPILDWQTLNETISYCHNDVLSLYALYQYPNSKGQKEFLEQATLRRLLSEEFSLNLHSASEAKIAEEIFAAELSPVMGIEKRELKTMRTHRENVALKDVMLPITFHDPDLQAVQYWFSQQVVNTSQGDLEKEKGPQLVRKIGDCTVTWALGGIHGCVKPGLYYTDKDYDLQSADVTSFYPMLAIKNGWHPAHIPKGAFLTTYEGFFTKRSQYPKSHFLNKSFKLVLNLSYGKSKDKHSFLYDPRFTFQITINGQLQLTKLIEMTLEGIPGTKLLMANTDGYEVLIPKGNKEKYYAICKEWEQMTKLSLEFVEYKSMIIRDVNNYYATWDDPETRKLKVKCKGAFEFEDLPLHKNKSFLVIPKALYAYFIHGIKPADYLQTNTNFFDYCAGAKLKGDWHFEEVENKEGTIVTHRHKKLLRYYISKRGNKIMKCLGTSKKQQLEAGKWRQTIANQYIEKPFAEYNIDFRYYLDAIHNEIRTIEAAAEVVVPNSKQAQLSLF